VVDVGRHKALVSGGIVDLAGIAGSTHDLTAARIQGIVDALAATAITCYADPCLPRGAPFPNWLMRTGAA
jgi:hypothetical protein